MDSLRLRKAFTFSLCDLLRNIMFSWICSCCKGLMSKRDRAFVLARKKLEASLDAASLVRTLTKVHIMKALLFSKSQQRLFPYFKHHLVDFQPGPEENQPLPPWNDLDSDTKVTLKESLLAQLSLNEKVSLRILKHIEDFGLPSDKEELETEQRTTKSNLQMIMD